jgi:hypothetical protein
LNLKEGAAVAKVRDGKEFRKLVEEVESLTAGISP